MMLDEHGNEQIFDLISKSLDPEQSLGKKTKNSYFKTNC